jgi:L-lactate dehydrogenase complex protein LldF
MTATWTLPGTTLRDRTAEATGNVRLRGALAKAVHRFSSHRAEALETIEDPYALRMAARRIRADVLADLPNLLATFADNVIANGGQVCWAPDAKAANDYIVSVARRIGAQRVVKSKSMATEETGLNHALEAAGIIPTETDLGEWIIQLAGQTPSHIIAPAVHLDRYQVKDIFSEHAAAPDELGTTPEELAGFARVKLRAEYLRADMGITGCNMAIAETGSIALVTNEGNEGLSTSVPRVHIAVMGMERIVADWEQFDLIINLLARSATGQHLSSYTNLITGPRRPGEVDGPDEFHVVILDNGRSEILGGEFHEALACIRCGACLNVCPVYRQVGGHAYGWVYSGPIGAVLTPLLNRRQEESAELANASTLCGACMDACPVGIPLQDLLLGLRRQKAEHASTAEKFAWSAWAKTWSRPLTYRASLKAAAGGRRLAPYVGKLPGLDRWGDGRTTLKPAARSFTEQWKAGRR